MQVSTANSVKVYNLSAGKSLPEWISERKRRTLLKNDLGLRRRIELIQDFTMPVASTHVQTSSDGQYILASGIYKPRIRCYDVHQLSMKFERCVDSEVVNFNLLSEDYSKFVLLLANRQLEFHAQYGFYYRTRVPRFGRDLAYHFPSCDLYITSDCSDIYRLNLEEGRFLTPLRSKSSGCTSCVFNSEHQLFTVGTEQGTIECWDPRSELCVGEVALPLDDGDNEALPTVTTLCYKDSLNLAVGTSAGQVMLYDLRSPQPHLVKDHYYGFPIHSISYQKEEGLVLSADSRTLKIWHERDGSAFTAVEPDHPINDLCHLPGSGLVLMATEDTRMLSYYIPAIGPAPRWCSFLDSLTEELEESLEPTLYEDYKFVTREDLNNLGLSHLIGSNLLRAYMHGFFMDMKLYHKAKSIAQPFAYEEYRKERIKKHLEEARANRIQGKKLPKINRILAEKLLSDKVTPTNKDVTNPIGDERFSALFSNPDFEVDPESEDFQHLHPIMAHREKLKNKKKIVTQSEGGIEEELEGRVSDDESSSEDEWVEGPPPVQPVAKPTKNLVDVVPLSQTTATGKRQSRATLGQRLTRGMSELSGVQEKGSVLGSREVKVQLSKPGTKDNEKRRQQREHRIERRKVRRSAHRILPRTDKRVFWRGCRIK